MSSQFLSVFSENYHLIAEPPSFSPLFLQPTFHQSPPTLPEPPKARSPEAQSLHRSHETVPRGEPTTFKTLAAPNMSMVWGYTVIYSVCIGTIGWRAFRPLHAPNTFKTPGVVFSSSMMRTVVAAQDLEGNLAAPG